MHVDAKHTLGNGVHITGGLFLERVCPVPLHAFEALSADQLASMPAADRGQGRRIRRQGRLWVATDRGLDRYDRRTDSFSTVSLGDLWVTTRASATTVREGDIAEFAIEVGNTGPSDATAIVLAIDAPAGLVATPTVGSFATRSIVFRGALTTLGRVADRGAIVSSSVQDANGANDTAETSLLVQRVAVLVPVTAVSADEVTAPVSSGPRLALASTATSPTGLAHTGADAQGGLLTALVLMLAGIALVVVRRRARR